MKKGNGTIRQRSDKCWEARFVVDGARKTLYGSSYREVRKRMTAAISEVDKGEYLEESNITIKQWLAEWMEYYLDIKASTRIRYQRDIRLYIEPRLGHIPLKELSASHVQKFYAFCKGLGLSPKSIRNVHGILHCALARAVKLELIRRNVTEMCDLPKMRRVEMHPMTGEQISKFLDISKGDCFFRAYYVALFTGIRESELVGLTWDCIDFNRGIIKVYRQYVRLGTCAGHTICGFTTCKNDRERYIEPAPSVMQLLREIQRENRIAKLRAGVQWKAEADFVFTKQDGSPLQYQTMYKHFKAIVTAMGLPEVRFHDLRHTFATISIQSGTDIKTVSETLGHATVAFTLDRYGHVNNTMRHEAAAKMDRFISAL